MFQIVENTTSIENPCHPYIIRNADISNSKLLHEFCKSYLTLRIQNGQDEVTSMQDLSVLVLGFLDYTTNQRVKVLTIEGKELSQEETFQWLMKNKSLRFLECEQIYRRYDTKQSLCVLCPLSLVYKNELLQEELSLLHYMVHSIEQFDYVMSLVDKHKELLLSLLESQKHNGRKIEKIGKDHLLGSLFQSHLDIGNAFPMAKKACVIPAMRYFAQAFCGETTSFFNMFIGGVFDGTISNLLRLMNEEGKRLPAYITQVKSYPSVLREYITAKILDSNMPADENSVEALFLQLANRTEYVPPSKIAFEEIKQKYLLAETKPEKKEPLSKPIEKKKETVSTNATRLDINDFLYDVAETQQNVSQEISLTEDVSIESVLVPAEIPSIANDISTSEILEQIYPSESLEEILPLSECDSVLSSDVLDEIVPIDLDNMELVSDEIIGEETPTEEHIIIEETPIKETIIIEETFFEKELSDNIEELSLEDGSLLAEEMLLDISSNDNKETPILTLSLLPTSTSYVEPEETPSQSENYSINEDGTIDVERINIIDVQEPLDLISENKISKAELIAHGIPITNDLKTRDMFSASVMKERKIYLEAILDDKNDFALVFYLRHEKVFFYTYFDTPESKNFITPFLTKNSFNKITGNPYLLYSVCRILGIPIKNIFSLQTAHYVIKKERESVSNLLSQYTTISKGFCNCLLLDQMIQYPLAFRTMLKTLEREKLRFLFLQEQHLDEALGDSYLHSIYMKSPGRLFQITKEDNFVFSDVIPDKSDFVGYIISYQLKCSDNRNLDDIIFELFSVLADKGRFRRCNVQIIYVGPNSFSLYVEQQIFDYMHTIINIELTDLGVEYDLPEFTIFTKYRMVAPSK